MPTPTEATKRKNKTKPSLEKRKESNDEKQGTQVGISKGKILTRILLAGTIMFIVHLSTKYNSNQNSTMATQSEIIPRKSQEIACSHANTKHFPGCSPKKCGRLVMDNIVTADEVASLLRIAKLGLSYGRSNGGASILDLHSGALSQGKNFVNIYTISKSEIFSSNDFEIYRKIKDKIKLKISEEFEIDPSKLYLTHPTFFSEITSKEAKTSHDEYWHMHVDKEQYKLFHYTSLLYLTDYGIDFRGGRFVFVGKQNVTIEPKKGRVSAFTSGYENPHYVEKVSHGTRYAITIPFTCDKSFAIADPKNK